MLQLVGDAGDHLVWPEVVDDKDPRVAPAGYLRDAAQGGTGAIIAHLDINGEPSMMSWNVGEPQFSRRCDRTLRQSHALKPTAGDSQYYSYWAIAFNDVSSMQCVRPAVVLSRGDLIARPSLRIVEKRQPQAPRKPGERPNVVFLVAR
jgi:hypothetical protein